MLRLNVKATGRYYKLLLLAAFVALFTFFGPGNFDNQVTTAQADANDQPVYNHYLFVYFKSLKYKPNDQQIHFAVSKDGLHYQALNHDQPTLPIQNHQVRDPFILRAKDGSFHILATSWDDSRGIGTAKRSILSMSSSDLTGWGYDYSTIASGDAGCTWAPEAIWDPIQQNYLVYWAESNSEDNYKDLSIWASRTSDFKNFSQAVPYIAPTGQSRIDATVFQNNDHFVRFVKNENSKHVYEDRVNALTDPQGTPIYSELLSNLKDVEGPETYKLYGQNKWVLLLDHYNDNGYEPYVSDNIDSGVFNKLDPKDYSIPDGARHGSVLPITEDEYNRLVQRWPF
ncbi:glycoside hydrolase family 43 protein [Agrilactobacillus fermenti]|uniref:glycoside hydrolase family 43 protein n=1 Tax=Agrilactobacillus fermenti TaxID=2586909 RepID=UPI001E47BAF9|nr:glycoside hydrolase family 43 protein [Agrilactobacillus fermenti]MCD2257043.1 glycoside hydrolase family 43 protein [Agrilactobacillus fermenti]